MDNKSPGFNPLQNKARRFALVIQLLFARQELTGKLATVNRGARHLSYGVRLSNPMQLDSALKLAEPLALSCGVNAVLAQRIEGVVSYQIELPQGFWEYYSRADLPTSQAVGLGERRRPILFELDPPHVLVAGTTGSGKSETLKSILLALVNTYSPADLGIVLIDPHRDYVDFANEAHLIRFEFGSIAHEPGEIQTALAWVNAELSHRKSEDVKDGRLIILAVGEAAEALASDESLLIARNVAKQARKYRIHLICETQKPTQADLPNILDMLLNRFVGQLADAKVSANVTGHSGMAAHKLTGKGDFLHLAGPQVDRFQVAMATPADFTGLERCEFAPVTVDRVDPIELPIDLGGTEPGRPEVQLNPEYLAWYFYHHPDKISRSKARELLGLKQRGHELHQQFCREFIKTYLELRNSNLKQVGA